MQPKWLMAAVLSFAALTARADELFVSIHSPSAMAQGAGLALAKQALAQQVPVRLLLCDAAGDIALTGQTLPSLKPMGVTPQRLLQGLMQAGAKVEVCALYLPNTGRMASDLLEGVQVAKPAEVLSHVMRPGVRTLSF